MDKLISLLSGGAPKAEDEEPESAIDELINTLEKGKETTAGDEEESVTVPAEQMSDEDIPDGVVQSQEELPTNPIPNADSAAMLMALKAVRPIIAAIPDKKAKQKACDSVMAQFKSVTKKSQNKNSYAAIMQSQRSTAVQRQKAQDAADAKLKSIEDGYKKQNPHYKEVK